MNHVGSQTGIERRGIIPGIGWLAVLIVWLGSGAYAGQVLNPSFEATYAGTPAPRPLPSAWGRASSLGRVDHPSFSSKCTYLWKTEGSLSAGLYSKLSNAAGTYVFNPGAHQDFCQDMDLTGISAIAFDVRLAAYPSGKFEHFEAELLVEGIPLWSQTEGGEYLDQTVNVSQFTDWCRVELRLTALDSGPFGLAYWTQWDNIGLVEGQTSIDAYVDLDPDTLNVQSQGKWITCYIELPDGFEAEDIDGATVALVLGDEEIPAHVDGPEGWATPEANEGNISDLNENGVLERMVKFERAAVEEIVQSPEATVAIRGYVDGMPFEGAATICVIDKGGKKK